MKLAVLVSGLFLSASAFAQSDDFKIYSCSQVSLNVQDITQARTFDFDEAQVKFALGSRRMGGRDAVDVLAVTYGSYCRMLTGSIGVNLNDAISEIVRGVLTVKMNVEMAYNEGAIERPVTVRISKNAASEKDTIRFSYPKLP